MYEPYPVPELAREHQHFRYSSLWTFAKQDLRLLLFFLLIASLIGFGVGYFWSCVFIAFVVFFALQLRSLYLVNDWISNRPYDVPPNLNGIWGALLFNVYRAQRQERIVQAEMVGLIDRAQSSLVALAEAVVLIDDQHQIEWWNPAAEKLLGISPLDRGRNLLAILRQPNFIEYFKHSDQAPDGIRLQVKMDEEHYVQVKLTRFGGESRLLVAYDITRMHNLEQMRKDFVDNISHELRTPLTVLSGYIETFTDQDDITPRWKRAFTQMQSQTKRMNALVNDLLLLSNLENNKKVAKNQIIDMANLMNQIFDDARAYNLDYGHTLNLDIDSHCDLIGSDMEIASAFSNLITNAIKYTPKGGIITIGWHEDGDHAYFTVQDTGIGINPKHLPRLTERFYRVDSARSRQTGGTGLGLAIVKHVLMQHGAYLEISSKENEGSTFTAVFPKERLYRMI
ncbi:MULTISPECIES: phosphate regulon sensor histidine kinase PhoR [Acinetobacter]|jgi:two-component system phosphate regulon sensor histidine kinase PhoR|uniref:Phosphate regulon sensor protein PhoR n=1 Tax=Acinetobacter parvus DSM 16617 = CIP 108168 TaxID=981333 RepID=N8RM04_9GAMM|nr:MULTISPECIES: phosphate regulon sensor histidine kinase PhoR [Acinetobacter]ENU35117.1 phosphate regulon sensor kinase PhoR [Acinetobacter parvus DSM 16617 = CIP 108168]ENU83785.1 phosphate regulon sensor kinase PhoR [Acinetobacter sp. CIP 102159]ENU88129.1 phosphate regulon sensor kinase PhoR [Acinetobacter sp. CIP 102529]ENU95443.1 phosphate regulon sensor kinase PhoR [Acinetobacter sp. CIP 102082]ENX68734.1 phosphate regulon sensor kinase PhoR [Acinetobacter sp. CIP 102143]